MTDEIIQPNGDAAEAAVPEGGHHVEEDGTEPFYTRPWFKIVALIIAVIVMLGLLGLVFSPRYWRF